MQNQISIFPAWCSGDIVSLADGHWGAIVSPTSTRWDEFWVELRGYDGIDVAVKFATREYRTVKVGAAWMERRNV